MDRLTVGAMLWQEGETLEKVLAALEPVADRFTLGVDHKSTDRTAEIARKWADDYFEFDFRDDFSEIRNMVLERAETPWFFQVDGHEVLTPQSVEFIQETLKQDNIDVVRVSLMLWDQREPLLLMMAARLFRTDRGLRYTRRIHNTLTHKDGHDVFLSLPMRDDIGITLDHCQSAARQEMRSDQRKEISVPGITEQAQTGGRGYDWYNLGVIKTYLDDNKGAREAFVKALEESDRDDASYQIKLFLAGLEKLDGDRDKARAILATATIDEPFRCEHLVELGALYEEEGDLDAALVFYDRAVRLIERFGIKTGSMTVYLPYVSYFPVERMMKIHGKKGDLKRAIEAGEKLRQYKYFQHKDEVESYLERFRKMITQKEDSNDGQAIQFSRR
tara:strand:+ start:1184 stop:2350 length:1167 start_codon:yes stop_codon:yes gene_type:complete